MELPSKELLGEVLEVEIEDVFYKGSSAYSAQEKVWFERGFLVNSKYLYFSTFSAHEDINIYELMHMMKEWALKKGYQTSNIEQDDFTGIKLSKKGYMDDVLYNKNYDESIKPEHIIEYCEWILQKESK